MTKTKILLVVVILAICILGVGYGALTTYVTLNTHGTISNPGSINDLITQFNETELHKTILDLQTLSPRNYGSLGNTNTATYLYNRLTNISGLTVEYQGAYKNVIATLQGVDSQIYMIGAHYDATSNSPGATDDGGGCAIVLEFARILSQCVFTHTIKFAFWNYEEGGALGSNEYVLAARNNGWNIQLYFNYDSSCYDPNNRYILDIMYNTKSAGIKDIIVDHNTLYGIGFSLTYNLHTCTSDYIPFWTFGYTAVMTHEETHGPAHTSEDSIDKANLVYAKKNGQLGMSVIIELAQKL